MNLEKESRIMKISIINVTKMGNDIAYKIKEHMDADLYSKYVTKELIAEASLEYKHSHCKDNKLNLLNDKHYFKKEDFNFKKIVKKSFQDYDAIIFISSTGIAVRAIASFIQSKDKDPAVIVIDSVGRYVISLLSGHLGGANELTEKIAKTIGAEPIITTATDNLNMKAPDIVAKENNLVIEDLKKAKEIAALLVNGQKVAFIDEDGLIDFPKGYVHNIEDARGIVFVTNKLYVDKTFLNENEQFISENESAYKKENLNSKKTVISKYAEENINPINKSVQLTIKHEDLEKQSLDNKCILKLIRKNIVLGIGCRKIMMI